MTLPKRIADFERLLTQAQAAGTQSEMLLQVMEPEAAGHFRLCAIPHQFDPDILRVMAPSLSDPQAQERCEEFSHLSGVTPVGDAWAIQDKWRHELFASWLQANNYPQFQSVSQRLTDFLHARVEESSGEARETALRRHMYHSVGADQTAGWVEFERLCRRARDNFRLTELAGLVRLVHDYDPVLTAEHVAGAAYHEGVLASDQRDWGRAHQLFTQVIESSAAAPARRARAYLRLGYTYAEQSKFQEAIDCYDHAREVAQTDAEAAKIIPRIVHDLGVVHRDLGDFERAEVLLKESVSLATAQRAWDTVAIAYNSLGRLYLNQHDPQHAISTFESALEKLEAAKDGLRASQVYNNIGLAYSELGDWQTSESWFRKSLDIKRQSGDASGQAFALNNLSRLSASQGRLEEAMTTATEAASLFEMVRDPGKAAVARQNIGKYCKKLKRLDAARQSFVAAIELFARANNSSGEAAARADLTGLDEVKPGLPWWVWVAVVLAGLLGTLVMVSLISELS